MNTPLALPASAATVLPRGYVPAFLFRQLADSPEFAEFARQMCEHALQAHELQASRDHPAVRRALELVEERFCDVNLALVDASKAASISVTHFSRLFHKKAGMTFTRYVQSRRVEEARRLLPDPDQSITVICFACGFNSLTHFNRIFRQSEGCSPSQFREKSKRALGDCRN